MSIVSRRGDKIVLGRIETRNFWDDVREQYAGADPYRWKYLAMLALKVNAGWHLDMIANAFGHERGHVSRAIATVRRELQTQFEWTPEPDGEEEFEL